MLPIHDLTDIRPGIPVRTPTWANRAGCKRLLDAIPQLFLKPGPTHSLCLLPHPIAAMHASPASPPPPTHLNTPIAPRRVRCKPPAQSRWNSPDAAQTPAATYVQSKLGRPSDDS